MISDICPLSLYEPKTRTNFILKLFYHPFWIPVFFIAFAELSFCRLCQLRWRTLGLLLVMANTRGIFSIRTLHSVSVPFCIRIGTRQKMIASYTRRAMRPCSVTLDTSPATWEAGSVAFEVRLQPVDPSWLLLRFGWTSSVFGDGGHC